MAFVASELTWWQVMLVVVGTIVVIYLVQLAYVLVRQRLTQQSQEDSESAVPRRDVFDFEDVEDVDMDRINARNIDRFMKARRMKGFKAQHINIEGEARDGEDDQQSRTSPKDWEV